jgi:hypothetical protein
LLVDHLRLEKSAVAEIFKDKIRIIPERLFGYCGAGTKEIEFEKQLLLGNLIADGIPDFDPDRFRLGGSPNYKSKIDGVGPAFGGLNGYCHDAFSSMQLLDRIPNADSRVRAVQRVGNYFSELFRRSDVAVYAFKGNIDVCDPAIFKLVLRKHGRKGRAEDQRTEYKELYRP